MKAKEKKIARELRSKGWSFNEIRRKLKVAKSSVSIWVRDIELTQKQRQKLSKQGIKKEIIEKRRKTRLENESSKRRVVINTAKKEIKNISEDKLKLIGVALYWAEGSKTQRGVVQFSNSDPQLIKIMMQFFKKICNVPETKFRGHVYLHPHLNASSAVRYWHGISNISLNQFFKTSMQQSRASKNKKESLPFGTFSIEICSTELFLSIKGWMEGLYDRITSRGSQVRIL